MSGLLSVSSRFVFMRWIFYLSPFDTYRSRFFGFVFVPKARLFERQTGAKYARRRSLERQHCTAGGRPALSVSGSLVRLEVHRMGHWSRDVLCAGGHQQYYSREWGGWEGACRYRRTRVTQSYNFDLIAMEHKL